MQGFGSGGILRPPPSGGIARPLNPPPQPTKDDWGDFAGFDKSSSSNSNSGSDSNWVQF